MKYNLFLKTSFHNYYNSFEMQTKNNNKIKAKRVNYILKNENFKNVFKLYNFSSNYSTWYRNVTISFEQEG